MNNLTPERRVDTNGRVVTRHVRNSGSPSPQMTSVPVPQRISSETKRSLATIVSSTVAEYAQMRQYSPVRSVAVHAGRREVLSYFEELPEDVAGECLDEVLASESDRGYASLLVSAVHNREDANMLSDVTFLYDPDREIVSVDEWDPEHGIASNHGYLRSMVNGIRGYREWGLVLPERFRLGSEREQSVVAALYDTTEFIYIVSHLQEPDGITFKHGDSGEKVSMSLEDRVLFDTVVTHHDRLEEIISVIEDRGCNGKILADYFAGHPPLRKGIL